MKVGDRKRIGVYLPRYRRLQIIRNKVVFRRGKDVLVGWLPRMQYGPYMDDAFWAACGYPNK